MNPPTPAPAGEGAKVRPDSSLPIKVHVRQDQSAYIEIGDITKLGSAPHAACDIELPAWAIRMVNEKLAHAPQPAPSARVKPDWAVKAAQTLREAITAAASDDYIANMIVGLVAARTDEADDWRVKYEAAHKLATEQCLKLAQEKDRADNAEKWAEARLAEMKATNDNWAKQVAAMAHPPQPPASEEVAKLRVEVATLRKQLEPIQSPESWAAVVGELDSIKQHVIPNYVAQLAAEQEARAKAEERERVAVASWDEERERALREGHRVTALTTRLQAAEAERDRLGMAVEDWKQSWSLAEAKAALAGKLADALNKISAIVSNEEKTAPTGGEVAPTCDPRDKELAFNNGYWAAAHNLHHDIAEVIATIRFDAAQTASAPSEAQKKEEK